jgi:hypothetical protein
LNRNDAEIAVERLSEEYDNRKENIAALTAEYDFIKKQIS